MPTRPFDSLTRAEAQEAFRQAFGWKNLPELIECEYNVHQDGVTLWKLRTKGDCHLSIYQNGLLNASFFNKWTHHYDAANVNAVALVRYMEELGIAFG